ncbi:MAG: DUF3179 domain-containing protein [Deinococcus sp.]|nr:DUF3179 domain-containing protein [Deinococcus sp.]
MRSRLKAWIATTLCVSSVALAVDLSLHSVPLEDIVIDTFYGGFIRLSNATPADIERFRDAIPPIDQPKFIPAREAYGVLERDLIIGVADEGDVRAYPFRILNFHEIVNDTVAGRPVLISYCPLCRSGIVYDRRLGDRVLSFGNTSALYQSDLVMYDRQTDSWWFQVAGEAIVGELTGARVTPLPSVVTTWAEWKQLHPDTVVLSFDTGYQRDYSRDPFLGLDEILNTRGPGILGFPTSPQVRADQRLPAGELVLGLDLGGQRRAYPLQSQGDRVYHDRLGDEAVVVFAIGGSGAAFPPVVNGQALRFVLQEGTIHDLDTGSTWSLAGRATSGPLAGVQLELLPARTTFWFAWVAAFPETDIAS